MNDIFNLIITTFNGTPIPEGYKILQKSKKIKIIEGDKAYTNDTHDFTDVKKYNIDQDTEEYYCIIRKSDITEENDKISTKDLVNTLFDGDPKDLERVLKVKSDKILKTVRAMRGRWHDNPYPLNNIVKEIENISIIENVLLEKVIIQKEQIKDLKEALNKFDKIFNKDQIENRIITDNLLKKL